MKNTIAKKPVSIRLADDVHQRLEQEARSSHESLTNVITKKLLRETEIEDVIFRIIEHSQNLHKSNWSQVSEILKELIKTHNNLIKEVKGLRKYLENKIP
ncbi:hypothetical protein Dthio_PD0491 [Desulfonatronospira thiodismutans ASO3-1]|uniref:Uncharacterized protein n=1 Tax=Desulfonatronospira thiodismutans ASO3-1 TaxID=555779 RepID=D6SR52_9BACT|nr:hypothetical protein [Desulfonatronospira thiodismutans]EFI33168.1 hypothetical protein Dthio_PD0491 [Desulfonatronospira thiodismutans ASO3-1]